MSEQVQEEEIVRVMRVIIYEGPRNWVENTVNRSIKGTKIVSNFDATDSMRIKGKITAQTINEFPEILQQHQNAIGHTDRQI